MVKQPERGRRSTAKRWVEIEANVAFREYEDFIRIEGILVDDHII